MKKTLILLSLLIMLTAASCGSDDNSTAETVANTSAATDVVLGETEPAQTTKKAVDGAVVPGTDSETTTTAPSPDVTTAGGEAPSTQPPAQKNGSISVDDLKLSFRGVTLAAGVDMNDIIKKIGQPDLLKKAPSCAYDGDDKTFVYDDVTIFTFPVDNADIISEITLGGNSVTTDKGARVGMTVAEIEAIYGKGYTLENDVMRYDFEKVGFMYANLKNGKAETIAISEW